MWVSQKNENRDRKKNRQSSSPHRPQEIDSLTASFPKSARILKHKHYVELTRNSRRFVGKVISIDYRLGCVSRAKLGITISKRQGKANIRNTFKRLVREVFRLYQHHLPSSLELNVYLRGGSSLPSIHQIEADFISFSQEFSQ